MGQVLLLLVVALTVAAVVFGVTVLVTGSDPGLGTAEPDGRAIPLPGNRPLLETDVGQVRFDTGLRGYRMGQVDQALRRTAYDIGYKDELIGVLQAEVAALREGRLSDAEVLRRAREAALAPAGVASGGPASGTGAVATAPGPGEARPAGDAPWSGLSTRGSAAGAANASVDVADAPADVAARSGPSDASADVAVRSGPAEPGRLEFERAEFGRTEPADGAGAAGRGDPGNGAQPADRAEAETAAGDDRDTEGDLAAPTRPVRTGGSVIEAEDGDLSAPTQVVRPGAAAEAAPESAAARTGAAGSAGDEDQDDVTTKLRRPMQTGGPAATAENEAEAPTTTRIRRPMQASGPTESSGPAESSERA